MCSRIFGSWWSLVLLAVFPAIAQAGAELRVGIASVDVTPEVGVPLGGFGGGARRIIPFDVFNRHKYAHYLKPSTGIADPIRAKAMVLERGGRRLLFLSLDTVGVTAALHRDLERRLAPLGFRDGQIFVSGTHTHSGPGTISSEGLWELLATDKFQPKIYARFMDGILSAVRGAVESEESAELMHVSFDTQGIQRNRRGLDGHFDSKAQLLMAMSSRGTWLGGLVNLPLHGTALGTDNHLFSADVLGGIERALETRLEELNGSLQGLTYSANRGSRDLPTVLFMNGAEGDVSPQDGGFEGIARMGDSFARQAVDALPSGRRIDPSWTIHRAKADLGNARLNLISCASGGLRKFIHRGLNLNLKKQLPRVADLWLLELGDLSLMTWPGEPTTDLGLELKQIARDAGAKEPWILGLTNGYLAYFTTPEEFRRGGYEACSSMYGDRGGTAILNAYRDLLASR